MTPSKILLVDDEPRNLFSLASILKCFNVEILTAHSGNEALGILLDEDCAVVLLDVCMPDMSGFEVAELLRQQKRTATLPIIFVTAIRKEQEHIFTGYELGAVDYMLKPLDPVIVRNKVNVFLELHQQKKLLMQRAIDSDHDLELTRKQLEEEKETLKCKNLVLNELFNHLEEEKKKVFDTLAANLDYSVFPLLDKLIEQNTPQKQLLEVIKKNLHELADPLISKAREVGDNLTPKELQLCNLIRQGLTVKEIASVTHLSPRTIDKHRENIRKKLNITGRKANLGAFLVSHLS
jgi:DNA-binding response OmpR family regulator/DNA-binding CsgD family transcriptional regulator